MSLVGAALAGAGGDILGSAAQGWFNAREASKNRRFQRGMSGSAYQRAAQDLEKAGLNRILALGSPASTPSGATASISQPTPGKTGVMAASAKQAIDTQKADETLKYEQTRLAGAKADREEFMTEIYRELQPELEKLLSNPKDFFGDMLPDFDVDVPGFNMDSSRGHDSWIEAEPSNASDAKALERKKRGRRRQIQSIGR